MKHDKKESHKACCTGTPEEKVQAKEEAYMTSQRELRTEIKKVETKTVEERLNNLHEKVKINHNTTWEARKKD